MLSKPPKPHQFVARTRKFGHFLGGAVTQLLKRSLHGLSRKPNQKLIKRMAGLDRRCHPPECGEGLSPKDPAGGSRRSHDHLELQLNDLDDSFNFLRNVLLAYWYYFWCPRAVKSEPGADTAQAFLDDFTCIFEAYGACEDGTGSGTGSGGTDPTTLGGTTVTGNFAWGAPRKSQKGNGKDNPNPDRQGNKSNRDATSVASAESRQSPGASLPTLLPGQMGEVCNHQCKRIGDVRLHLWRRHRQILHCPVCGLTFDSEEASEAHITQRTCVPAGFYHPGMTRDQWGDICARAQAGPHTVNGGDEERWFQIWDILFPGQPRPRSPYTNGSIFAMQFDYIARRFVDEGRARDLVYELFPMDAPNVHPEYRHELHAVFEDLIRRLVARAGEEDRLHGINRAP
ncbi:hypothetical protein PG993_012712 [Apiospora rasikravindrae]|uniref:C2H2-type domain-containing protein n=1 Tax=Apiospora rasikravindrae TaxID=990691 RepID=A0ABR1S3B9_9PEZI